MNKRKLLFLMNAEQALAFARLVEAAERGDGAAACILGDRYRVGSGGLSHSPKRAFHWYSRSALAGDPNGQCNLGACFEHGIGCTQSYARAVKWYRLSTAQGLGTAAMNLGYCYLHGHGVSADKGEALKSFRLAVQRGEARAEPEVARLAPPTERKSRVRIVDVTEPGRHMGIIAAGAESHSGCAAESSESTGSRRPW